MGFNLNRLGWVLAVVFGVALLFKTCGKSTETVDVNVPEQSGEFDEQEPIYITKRDTVYITKWRTKTDTIEIETQNPVNDSLAKAYADLQGEFDASFRRYEMYLDAIQIRNFENTFEDEYLKIVMSGRVQGDLLGIKPKYTIKERTVQTEVESAKLRVLIGGDLGNNTSFDNFLFRPRLSIQNAKGNILSASYSKIANQDYFFVGYDFSLFQLK